MARSSSWPASPTHGAPFRPAQRSDPAAALAGAPATPGCGCCSRTSRAARLRPQPAGFDLQLSGHTHGGQFLPWNFLVRLQQPFTAGLHRCAALWVYTSRGTGYWGPPKRFGAPSEITVCGWFQARRSVHLDVGGLGDADPLGNL